MNIRFSIWTWVLEVIANVELELDKEGATKMLYEFNLILSQPMIKLWDVSAVQRVGKTKTSRLSIILN